MGSVGPAGFTKSGLPADGFIFTWSIPPKGLGGMVPGLRNQRRLNTCSGACVVRHANWAGRKRFAAQRTPSTIRCTTKAR